MEASKLPSIKWMFAMYLCMHKIGISSVQLSKDLGVTQKTAWVIVQRVRWALGNEEQTQLEGNIQLDETSVGGKNKNRHADKKFKQCQGRSFKDKTPVMGMLQEQEYEMVSRPHKMIEGKTVVEKIINKQSVVKCKVVSDTISSSIQPIIKQNVKAGSLLVSDEWHAYRGLSSIYEHQVVDHSRKQYVNDAGYTSNALEGFRTQCKLSIHAMYVRPTRKHLQKYFFEFAFRYNYRNLAIQEQMEAIIRNMECRLKYKDLIA